MFFQVLSQNSWTDTSNSCISKRGSSSTAMQLPQPCLDFRWALSLQLIPYPYWMMTKQRSSGRLADCDVQGVPKLSLDLRDVDVDRGWLSSVPSGMQAVEASVQEANQTGCRTRFGSAPLIIGRQEHCSPLYLGVVLRWWSDICSIQDLQQLSRTTRKVEAKVYASLDSILFFSCFLTGANLLSHLRSPLPCSNVRAGGAKRFEDIVHLQLELCNGR